MEIVACTINDGNLGGDVGGDNCDCAAIRRLSSVNDDVSKRVAASIELVVASCVVSIPPKSDSSVSISAKVCKASPVTASGCTPSSASSGALDDVAVELDSVLVAVTNLRGLRRLGTGG
jgi:hypothetical protein